MASKRGIELEVERCRDEIAQIEAALRAGHTEVAGLCLALADWSAELRILNNEQRRRAENPAAHRSQTDE
jgi:hypothetical protein